MQVKYKAYVYLITNKVTNQFYYGSRASNVRFKRTPTEDLWIHYFTSSKKVKELINLHGKDSFDTRIIFEHDSYDMCFWEEQRLIRESKKDQLRLNVAYIDKDSNSRILTSYGESVEDKDKRIKKMQLAKKGKFNSNGQLGMTRSDETKQKMSLAQSRPDLVEARAQTMSDTMKGRKKTPEQLAKYSAICKGRPWTEARRQAQINKKEKK